MDTPADAAVTPGLDASLDALSTAPDAADAAAADTGDSAPACTATTQTRKFVMNAILLPQQKSDYAIDLNGDGNVDNMLGNLVGVLGAQNLDSQATMDSAIAAGQALHLLDETSSDSSFQADPTCASAGAQLANAQANPVLDGGTATFTPDPTAARGAFRGAIAASAFDATQPSTMKVPVELDVKLALATAVVRLHVTAAHVSFTFAGGRIVGGKLQGVLRASEVKDTLVPGLASGLNASVQADPTSQNSTQLLSIFDNGGNCQAGDKNFDNTAAASGDGKIAVCEVATNAIIKNLTNPDVQMFDAMGAYSPNPANTTKDSWSIAFGFVAIPASY